MKMIFKLCLIGMGFLVLASTGWAAKKTFIMGVESTSYFPQYDHDNMEEYIGYAREVLDAFAASKNYEFQYKMMPIKRLFQEFVEQKVDFKYPDHPYWQADIKKGSKVVYSDPVVGYIDGVMVLPDRKGQGMEKLKILGTVRGFTAWDFFDQINAGKMTVAENNNFTGLLKQGIIGRVDGAYINIAVANYQLNEILKQPGALVFDPGLPHTKSAYSFSSIKYPDVVQEMNEFLKVKKDLVSELKKKYAVENF